MAIIDTVLLKIASRCNLDCSYCYIYQMGNDHWKSQPKKMSEKTLVQIADELAKLAESQGQAFSVVFHGGEPLLVGAVQFENMCKVLREALPKGCSLHLQTNGVLLSDRIISACLLYDVGISISVDGPASVHDANRVDHRALGSHRRVLAGIEKLASHADGARLFTGVLAVIDVRSDPIGVYEYLKSIGSPSMDFLYRDGNHDVLPPGKSSVHSTEFGEWMGKLLDHYLEDRAPTPVRFLDDMIKLVIGGVGRKEGVGINDYGIFVIETDGTIAKNDTLKSASKQADKFDLDRLVLDGNLVEFVNSNEFLEYHETQRPTAAICQSCTLLQVCGGGMPAHRFSKDRGLDNPSVFCSDQTFLIERIQHQIRHRNVAA